jgi:hypothetical protein
VSFQILTAMSKKLAALMMETVSTSQMSAYVYQTKWPSFPEDGNYNIMNYLTPLLTWTECLSVTEISGGLSENNNESLGSVDIGHFLWYE